MALMYLKHIGQPTGFKSGFGSGGGLSPLPPVSSNWILATGFWNDNGVWDDNAVWID